MKQNRRSRRVALGAALAALVSFASLARSEIIYMVCSLSGMQEVPANASPGMGCGTFVIDTNLNTLTYRIVVGSLSTVETAAHIHGAANPGVNAGVIHPLPAGSLKVGVWNYPEAQQANILAGRCYVNVHTTALPGGEVRGQICSAVAELDGMQETPPNAAPSRGFGIFMIDQCSNTVGYYVHFPGGLTAAEVGAHVHAYAAHGTAAGVYAALPAGTPKIGAYSYAEAEEDRILHGLSYVNIHSAAFPGGEIRGQIVTCVAPLDGSQEVPPTPSTAIGCGLYSMHTGLNQLGFDIRRTSLGAAETAAHIHGFAPPGVNAGVLFPLPAGPRKLGVWNFAEAQEAGILAGNTYANIHSTAFGGGEIRGQIACRHRCRVDVDGDGFPTGDDFTMYVEWFETGDPRADFDCDGFPTGDDFTLYVELFEIGC